MQIEYIVKLLEEKFWGKVSKGPGCWEWAGGTDGTGYGTLERMINKKRWRFQAHRYSWLLHNGPIPGGLLVCHQCDNRRCVNPAHLFLGTAKDNTADMIAKGRSKFGTLTSETARTTRLTADQVLEIRRLRSEGVLLRELAARFGVAIPTISHAANGDTWRKV
jgi:hypothetical protein